MRAEELDDLGLDAVRRLVAIVNVAIRVSPLIDDGGGHRGPDDQGTKQ
jgi:hypothetical protein